MILVDTSIWVDHLKTGDETLAALLHASQVLVHPHVVAELALGNTAEDGPLLALLKNMPAAPMASHEEVLRMIQLAELPGSGIGYVDVHLLASTRLYPGARLWTRDRRLGIVAGRLGLNRPEAEPH